MAFLEIEQPRQAVPSFMDMTKMKIATEEEVQSALFKLSDLRLKPEKLREDEIRTIIMFTSTTPADKYPFLDPVPPSMRNVNMRELSQVDIDWKMLTLARPTTKQEEEVFTRFVELDKLGLRSVAEEEVKGTRIIKPRQGRVVRPLEDSADETTDNLDEFTYEYFVRQLVVEDTSNMNDQILLDDGPEVEPKKKPPPRKVGISPAPTPAPKTDDGGSKRNLPIISAINKNRKAAIGTKKPVATQRLSANKRPSVAISRKVSPRPKSSSIKSGGAEKENKKKNNPQKQQKKQAQSQSRKEKEGKAKGNNNNNNNNKGASKTVKKSGKTAKKKKSKNKGE